jgi:hypothetical protein
VLCVDEKPQIQAVEGTTPMLPLRPGQLERRSPDYKRHGTLELFAAPRVTALGWSRSPGFNLLQKHQRVLLERRDGRCRICV